MTFSSFDIWWWPYLFILLVGVLPTSLWRWTGVVLIGEIEQGSQALILIRCVATSLVAAVIAQLIFSPGGALALIPLWVRLGAAFGGAVAFFLGGRRMSAGIVAGELLLFVGYLATG